MFLAGLEIDVADFRKNSTKSILFAYLLSLILEAQYSFHVS